MANETKAGAPWRSEKVWLSVICLAALIVAGGLGLITINGESLVLLVLGLMGLRTYQAAKTGTP